MYTKYVNESVLPIRPVPTRQSVLPFQYLPKIQSNPPWSDLLKMNQSSHQTSQKDLSSPIRPPKSLVQSVRPIRPSKIAGQSVVGILDLIKWPPKRSRVLFIRISQNESVLPSDLPKWIYILPSVFHNQEAECSSNFQAIWSSPKWMQSLPLRLSQNESVNPTMTVSKIQRFSDSHQTLPKAESWKSSHFLRPPKHESVLPDQTGKSQNESVLPLRPSKIESWSIPFWTMSNSIRMFKVTIPSWT